MPKHGFLTPKAISNRIKSKGLQKLRWYCQMCQKQCRDENGFKCHMMSESHQRQMLLVAENPGKYIGAFSQEFLRDFMSLLRLQYGTRRVRANEVYQEYIKDKNHYHMNATRWETLTGFVMFLGKTGMCEVEPSEKGWYIKYIDRSPETLARQAAAEKKKKMDKDDEERVQQAIEQQIERALANKKDEDDKEPVYTELKRENEDEKISFSLKMGGATVSGGSSANGTSSSGESSSSHDLEASRDRGSSECAEGEEEFDDREGVVTEEEMMLAVGVMASLSSSAMSERTDESVGGASAEVSSSSSSSKSSRGGSEDGFARPKAPLSKQAPLALPNALKLAASAKRKEREGSASSTSSQGESRKRKRSALEEIRMMEEERKEKVNRRENWITEGIVVKVLHKKLGDRFYKKKGVVEAVRDTFTGVVKMIETGDKIKIDQAHLETVIPAIGKPVMVVNGAYRGLRAIMEGLNTDSFSVAIKINQGPARGRVIDKVPYEDVSKLA